AAHLDDAPDRRGKRPAVRRRPGHAAPVARAAAGGGWRRGPPARDGPPPPPGRPPPRRPAAPGLPDHPAAPPLPGKRDQLLSALPDWGKNAGRPLPVPFAQRRLAAFRGGVGSGSRTGVSARPIFL